MPSDKRLAVGFHRIGLALFGLCALMALAAAGMATSAYLSTPRSFEEQLRGVEADQSNKRPDGSTDWAGAVLKRSLSPDEMKQEARSRHLSDISYRSSAIEVWVILSIATLLAGTVLYALSWVIGWIVRGFAGG